jgi:hypothetical protein
VIGKGLEFVGECKRGYYPGHFLPPKRLILRITGAWSAVIGVLLRLCKPFGADGTYSIVGDAADVVQIKQ